MEGCGGGGGKWQIYNKGVEGFRKVVKNDEEIRLDRETKNERTVRIKLRMGGGNESISLFTAEM